jgi:hypothetical protein
MKCTSISFDSAQDDTLSVLVLLLEIHKRVANDIRAHS